MYKSKITKEELKNVPVVYFEGEVFLIDEYEQIFSVLDYLKNKPVLGFDTETRPNFKKGQRNKVALLQLSTAEKSFLFRINKIGLPPEIISLLSNKNILKVGAAIHDDIKALKRIQNFEPESFLDLQKYIKKFKIESSSLQKMSAIILGFRITKNQRLTNWDDEKLTPAQQRYAATDAWVGYKIYEKLTN